MPNPRKQIILNEILFWKQNKLLPEHYCDFLMTLYSEGNEVQVESKVSHKKAVKAKEKRKRNVLLIFLILFAIALVVLLFTMTEFTWLISLVVGVLALVFMFSAFNFAKKNDLIAPILQTAAALLILGLSVKVSLTYFENNTMVLYVLLIANCLMWTITGLKLKLMYFTISGTLGVVALIGYQLFFI